MKAWTWGEMLAKVEDELDLAEETFIDSAELMSYGNDAIDEAEQMILLLYQDYFRTQYVLPLALGVSAYELPPTIYAHKIMQIWYKLNNLTYKVVRIKMRDIPYVQPYDDYRFDIEDTGLGTTNGGAQLVLYPASREADLGQTLRTVTVWFIRNANRLVNSSTIIDVPEANKFIFAYIRERVFAKEMHPLLQDAQAKLQMERDALKQVLDQLCPDEDEVLEPDLAFYNDFDQGDF